MLAQAVRAGVIDRAAAQLIGDTRIERQPLLTAARRQGFSAGAGGGRRRRAERRLICFLGHRSLVGFYDLHVSDREMRALP